MPPKSGGGEEEQSGKQVTNKRRRGFIDPDLRVSKRQERKDDAKFVKAKFGNFQGGDGRDEGAETQVASTSSSEDEDLDAKFREASSRKHGDGRTSSRISRNASPRWTWTCTERRAHCASTRCRSACFFHETLMKCAELNCGAHFSDFKREAEPLCQSLPMLVLHQDKVLASLLERLVPEARHSLEALLRCLQALARDLRGDFAPSCVCSCAALAALMRSTTSHESRRSRARFPGRRSCASGCVGLAGDLVHALCKTRALRRGPQAHVRGFAAQAVAFLLAVASWSARELRPGVRALLAEALRRLFAPHREGDRGGPARRRRPHRGGGEGRRAHVLLDGHAVDAQLIREAGGAPPAR